MRIKPFRTLRPPPALAAEVASMPYDVGELAEARREAAANPRSFLHVERPEVDLPDGADPETLHRHAAETLGEFIRAGWLIHDPEPALYLYRLASGAHVQTGFVAACGAEDYDAGVIRRHEKTRKPTEDERTLHVELTNANTGPIYLIYPDELALAAAVAREAARPPLVDFTAADGVRHTLWKAGRADDVVAAFAAMPMVYIADGHHRAASAARVAAERRERNPCHRGDEEYNGILGVLFPASELRILAYNRAARDLNGLAPEAFLRRVREIFTVEEGGAPVPAAPGRASMYLGGRWCGLAWPSASTDNPVAALDVSVLQDRLLAPVLGVTDPRNSERMEYLGGPGSAEGLARRVDAGRCAVAFSMYPTPIAQLLEVAGANLIMPPKSTWFDPKLRSGLFVRPLD